MLPEGPAPADLVLPEARLRLVDAQRASTAQGVAELLTRQALLVDTVAGLVQDAEEGLVEVARIVARGEPAIAGTGAAAKWMGGHVQPAGVEVKPDGRGGRLAEEPLQLHRIFTLQDVAPGLARRPGDGGDQRHQLADARPRRRWRSPGWSLPARTRRARRRRERPGSRPPALPHV